MSLLSTIGIPRTRQLTATIYGGAGAGKTSLAKLFANDGKKVLFICTEDGLQSISGVPNISSFPLAKTFDEVVNQLLSLIREEHDYEVLIIDSISALDQICIKKVMSEDPTNPKSINCALKGYGAGLEAVGSLHSRIREACDILNRKKDMTIIFLGHDQQKTSDRPDSEPYTYYDLKVTKKATAHYIDNVDVVGYLKLRSFIKPSDKDSKVNKIVSSQERVLVVHSNYSYVTKNRFGITNEIEIIEGENPFSLMVQSVENNHE